MIRIRAFRAPDDQETCKKFIAGHRHILEVYYGIIKITSDSTEWTKDPFCIVIVAEDAESGRVYGGARIQLAGGMHKLPLEYAIMKYDKNVTVEINNSQLEGGTGEICGLWNSKEIAGMGIGSRILSMTAVGIGDQLNIKSIYALCAPGTLKITHRMGFSIVKTLGNEGTFFYPKDNFVATVMKLNDIYDLSLAAEDERQRILFYRNNINGTSTETGPKGTYDVIFDLKISK
jgi:hypothetical protein